MDLSKVIADAKNPQEFYVLIEIPQDSAPVKYEFDKDIGALVVDRFMPSAMFYPCNYGFLPNSLSEDGDPLDVLVYTNYPIVHGALIKVKPIGVLLTEDEKGGDEKIIAVPTDKCNMMFKQVNDLNDLPEVLLQRITNFFERYKDLEPGKWVKVQGFAGRDKAHEVVSAAINRYQGK